MTERDDIRSERELTINDLLSILDYRISQGGARGINPATETKLKGARSVLLTPDMHAYHGASMIVEELRSRKGKLRNIIGSLGMRLGRGEKGVNDQLATLTVLDEEISNCIDFVDGEIKMPSSDEPEYQKFVARRKQKSK